MVALLIDYGDYANQFLQLSNERETECTIWTLEEDEATPLANLWLMRAQRDPRAAAALRTALDGNDYLRAALVLGPRLYATSQFYPENGGFRLKQWRANDERRRARMRVVHGNSNSNGTSGEQGPAS